MIFAITGASGFIGSSLALFLLKSGHQIRLICRTDSKVLSCLEPFCLRGDLSDHGFLLSAFSGVEVVYHLAARAHVLQASSNSDDEYKFFDSNVRLSDLVFNAASFAGVRRLVFLSSIAVLGDSTNNIPFNDLSVPSPTSLYGRSKYMAELILVDKFSDSSMDWVVLRPPLVYGLRAPGNLNLLISVISKLPVLPFRLLKKQKSYISLDSLVQCLHTVACGNCFSRQFFLVSDPGTISFSLIASVLLRVRGLPDFLNFPVPAPFLSFLFLLFGKSSLWRKINTQLLVDSSRFMSLSKWNSHADAALVLSECIADAKVK